MDRMSKDTCMKGVSKLLVEQVGKIHVILVK